MLAILNFLTEYPRLILCPLLMQAEIQFLFHLLAPPQQVEVQPIPIDHPNHQDQGQGQDQNQNQGFQHQVHHHQQVDLVIRTPFRQLCPLMA